MGVKRSRSNSASSIDAPSTPSARESSVDVKLVHLDVDSAPSAHVPVMRCSLPPHEPMTFGTFEEYDVHYQKAHAYRCSECHKNFPDEHFLDLHIAENHDPIKAALRDKGEKTYACLIPTCPRLCSTPQKRRLHCIDAHSFPRSYDFFIINDGIDRRSSMLRPQRRRSSTANSASNEEKGRKRSSTVTSGIMDIVPDDEDRGYENAHESDGATDFFSSTAPPSHPPTSPTRTVKLGGRGGIGLGRSIPGPGRAEQRRHSTSTTKAQVSLAKTEVPAQDQGVEDPIDGLVGRMSALQFVPHSVRMGQGRGRGRGKGAIGRGG